MERVRVGDQDRSYVGIIYLAVFNNLPCRAAGPAESGTMKVLFLLELSLSHLPATFSSCLSIQLQWGINLLATEAVVAVVVA